MAGMTFINKLPQAEARVLRNAKLIRDAILEDLDKESYTRAPAVTNEMRNARQVVREGTGGHIIYPKVYSARLYFGVDFSFTKIVNPNAGPLWGQRAIATNKKKWLQISGLISRGGMH